VPRHGGKWHGYPIRMAMYPQKSYTNNRFRREGDVTLFENDDPHKVVVQYFVCSGQEWQTAVSICSSQKEREKIRAPYEEYGTVLGTLRMGECDSNIVKRIKPALVCRTVEY